MRRQYDYQHHLHSTAVYLENVVLGTSYVFCVKSNPITGLGRP
jgi:hypothetical protein